jgi:tetratricopeptide (TPR) repeat protein
MLNSPQNSNLETLDALWQARHESAQLDALEASLTAALASGREYSHLWRAARLAHFRALQSEDSGQNDAALRFFEIGKNHAHHAVEANHHDVEGQFWLGVCVLEYSRRKSWIAAASALKNAESHIQRAMNQDETYHFAGPLRVMARITHHKPLLLGGSLERALDIYRRALQIFPENSTTLLYYCETLLADQQKNLARETLQKIISAPEDADWVWEQARDRRLAKELLAKMNAAH